MINFTQSELHIPILANDSDYFRIPLDVTNHSIKFKGQKDQLLESLSNSISFTRNLFPQKQNINNKGGW